MTDYYGVIGNRDSMKLQGQKLPFWHFLDAHPAGWLCSLAYKRDDGPATGRASGIAAPGATRPKRPRAWAAVM